MEAGTPGRLVQPRGPSESFEAEVVDSRVAGVAVAGSKNLEGTRGTPVVVDSKAAGTVAVVG